jgi:hypothetical protein
LDLEKALGGRVNEGPGGSIGCKGGLVEVKDRGDHVVDIVERGPEDRPPRQPELGLGA